MYFGHWWDSDYVDNHTLARLRWLVLLSTISLFFVRFILMYLVVKLGYLKMSDDGEDLRTYAPNIQDVRIDPDFSQSAIHISQY